MKTGRYISMQIDVLELMPTRWLREILFHTELILNMVQSGVRVSFSAPKAKTAKDAVAPKSDKNPLKRCFRGFFHAFSEDFARHPKAVFRHLGVPKVSHRFDMNLKWDTLRKKVGHLGFFQTVLQRFT